MEKLRDRLFSFKPSLKRPSLNCILVTWQWQNNKN